MSKKRWFLPHRYESSPVSIIHTKDFPSQFWMATADTYFQHLSGYHLQDRQQLAIGIVIRLGAESQASVRHSLAHQCKAAARSELELRRPAFRQITLRSEPLELRVKNPQGHHQTRSLVPASRQRSPLGHAAVATLAI